MKKILKDHKLMVIIVILMAFFVRLIAINQSLWLDEGTTARVVQEYRFTQIISGFSLKDFHPPLYYLFMKLWTNIFGYSEIALRLPSIIFSLIAGYFVYLLGRNYLKLKRGPSTSLRTNFSSEEEKFGIWSAAFFLFNPLIVYYSQEARMYMMATFFICASLYFLLFLRHAELVSASIIRSRNKFGMTKALIMMYLFMILAFVTFYGSIFFIAAILIYLLYKKQFKLFFVTCFMLCVTCLILSPLLYQQLTNAKQTLQIVSNWSLVLGKANLKNLLLIPIKFTSGRISFEPKKIYYLISGLWLLIVTWFYAKGGTKNKFLIFLVKTPLLFGFLVSFITPMLQYFRFLYLIVPMSLLLGLGANKNWQRYLLFTGFLIFSLVYLLNPAFHREDWKNLAQSIPVNSTVYAIPSSMDSFLYYRSDLKLKIEDLRRLNKPVNSLTREPVNQLIVIPYTSEIYGINYQENLQKQQFKLKNTKSFRGLTLEYWQKTSTLY